MKSRPQSQKIYDNLCHIIPGGVNSPVRACHKMGQLPMVVDSGHGDTLRDVDGHSYIDYCCSWGALIHGHAHPTITKAVQKKVESGTTFGITSSTEDRLASLVVSLIDSIEKIRFVSSGTEATMTAIRLARGFTQRDLIVKFEGNYHGHADFLLVKAGSGVLGMNPSSSSSGVPEDIVKHTVCLPYNDVEAAKNFFSNPLNSQRIAAVILEPVVGNMGTVAATHEFIQYLREATEKVGALLIFDEVITGFRLGLKGAQAYYQVTPDLTCFGKIIGGGFPAAAFGGRKEIMDHLAPLGTVYQAGTLSGNPIAMEAGYQSLRLLQEPKFYEELERKANLLTHPIKGTIAKSGVNACIQQVGSMFTIFFGKRAVNNLDDAKNLDETTYAKLFRYLFDNGVYIPPSQHEAWFVSSAHTDKHLSETADLINKFLIENNMHFSV